VSSKSHKDSIVRASPNSGFPIDFKFHVTISVAVNSYVSEGGGYVTRLLSKVHSVLVFHCCSDLIVAVLASSRYEVLQVYSVKPSLMYKSNYLGNKT
jgi:hypothetical protein